MINDPKISKMKFAHKLTYHLLNIFSKWLQKKSFSSRIRFSRRMGYFVYYFLPIRKKLAALNIKKAFPERNKSFYKKTLKDLYYVSCRNFVDLMALPTSKSDTKFDIKGKHYLDDAIKEKKGVILVTGHFGLWELWGSWLGLNHYKIWGIIQRQKNLGADLFFKQKRESYGINHIYRRSSLDVSYNALNNGEILILASDQNAKQKGVKVNFFNHSSSTPKGAAIFHLRTKAPIIFSVLEISNEDKVRITFKKIKTTKESSVESITQDYTSKLEDFVRKNPSHYFWFHNKWKE